MTFFPPPQASPFSQSGRWRKLKVAAGFSFRRRREKNRRPLICESGRESGPQKWLTTIFDASTRTVTLSETG